MKAKKQILIAALLIVVSVSGLFGVYVYHKHRHFYHTVWSYGKAIYHGDIWQRYQGSDVHVSDVYAKHLAAGRAYGWSPIEDKNSVKEYEKKKKLVAVNDGIGYEINDGLHFSHSVLTNDAYTVLKEIGVEFARNTSDDDFFVVTSLTRTIADQQRLTRSNRSATRGTSSHSYGCSFDISYKRFNGVISYNASLQKVLEKILINKRSNHKILFIFERTSSCYHITVPPIKNS